MNDFYNLLAFLFFALVIAGIGSFFSYLSFAQQKARIVLRNLGDRKHLGGSTLGRMSFESIWDEGTNIAQAKESIGYQAARGPMTRKSTKCRIAWISLSFSIGLLAAFLFFSSKPLVFFAVLAASVCFGFLISERAIRVQGDRYRKEIAFYLPIVMERIVMAVQAGLDILPALKAIEQIESSEESGQSAQKDEVTKLLSLVICLCESGLSFEEALRSVANSVKSSALRHCFIHLAVAHKEGGELIYPLKELSDATQLYFQESIEEEIAKMPVKATLPLLLTFAGLIITFMTGPVVQIMNVSANPRLVNQVTSANQGLVHKELNEIQR